jgi:gmma-aminobutyric acid receptor subunit gamma
VATHDSNTIIKIADDTMVLGLITGDNETLYREEVSDNNNLSLNVSMTKELIVDYRKWWGEHASHQRGCSETGRELQVPRWSNH